VRTYAHREYIRVCDRMLIRILIISCAKLSFRRYSMRSAQLELINESTHTHTDIPVLSYFCVSCAFCANTTIHHIAALGGRFLKYYYLLRCIYTFLRGRDGEREREREKERERAENSSSVDLRDYARTRKPR